MLVSWLWSSFCLVNYKRTLVLCVSGGSAPSQERKGLVSCLVIRYSCSSAHATLAVMQCAWNCTREDLAAGWSERVLGTAPTNYWTRTSGTWLVSPCIWDIAPTYWKWRGTRSHWAALLPAAVQLLYRHDTRPFLSCEGASLTDYLSLWLRIWSNPTLNTIEIYYTNLILSFCVILS